MRTHAQTHAHTHMHAQTHAHTHMLTHIYTHVHAHTCWSFPLAFLERLAASAASGLLAAAAASSTLARSHTCAAMPHGRAVQQGVARREAAGARRKGTRSNGHGVTRNTATTGGARALRYLSSDTLVQQHRRCTRGAWCAHTPSPAPAPAPAP